MAVGRLERSEELAMKRAVVALILIIAAITAHADPYKVQPVGDEASSWAGKTVVVTARPQARFMSYSRVKITFGLFGIAAAAVQGKQIIEHNGIENPAPRLAQALFEAGRDRYGVVPAPLAPLSLASDDAVVVARAGHGADLVFDVQQTGGSLEPLLSTASGYFVTSELRFRVIDVASGHVLGDATCVRTTQLNPDLLTRDELLADHAARLKTILGTQRDFCLEYFRVQVLRLPPT
jgi:hypothetical protein